MDTTDKIFIIVAVLISLCIMIGGIFVAIVSGIYFYLGIISSIIGLNSLIGSVLRGFRKLESPSLYFLISNFLNIATIIIAVICLWLGMQWGSGGTSLILGAILILIGGGYTLVLFVLRFFSSNDEEE